ncbi:uncharacterized protein LOC106363283 isoform X1 [Brassica napus]|uniref:uncharacterized protein LOC106363283 isoform X1 n=1 Tax=Brassica napus TaxID=3708 RepID=UPI00207ABD9A|nr:uncharacterized protein LOC106363283 isoform X1 [Brassica napus]
MKLLATALFSVTFGILLGLSFPSLWIPKVSLPQNLLRSIAISSRHSDIAAPVQATDISKIWVPSNPKGAERLPPGIIASESDLYLRRFWGNPEENLKKKPRYLVTFTVGYEQRQNIDACVKKFSDNFTIVLFHYDGRTSEWDDEFEWSKNVIHISVRKQTKWWYAKRFLHPDIVARYDYIFIWDEDLGVDHFDAEKYLHMVKKHGLEISQPGLDPEILCTWQITKKREHVEVHKEETNEKPERCLDPHQPPCAAFVEIMAPVFSRDAWRCVWHMIQVTHLLYYPLSSSVLLLLFLVLFSNSCLHLIMNPNNRMIWFTVGVLTLHSEGVLRYTKHYMSFSVIEMFFFWLFN